MPDLDKIDVKKETSALFLGLAAAAPRDAELYQCPACRDTGWLMTEEGATPCSCGRQDALLYRRRAAGLSEAMDKMRFANFDLRHYTETRQQENGQTYRQAAEKALRAAKGFVAAALRGTNPRGLYFEGTLGSGKTFLAAAIANELAERDQDVRFIVVPEFLDQLRLSYRNQEGQTHDEAELMRRALQARVLVLDDLGAHNSTAWTINKIYTLLNHRLNKNLPCIITSNLQPRALAEELGQRTASRIREICDRYLLLADQDIRAVKQDSGRGWA